MGTKHDILKQILVELIQVKNGIKTITIDADFTFMNGKKHYEKHMELKELPSNMTFEEYVRKAKEVSLRSINGRTVKAYKYDGDRIAKTDGNWFVSYKGGKGGTLVTAFPLRGGIGRFYTLMNRDYGVEINKE